MSMNDFDRLWVVEWCSSGDQKGIFHIQNLGDTLRTNLGVFFGIAAARYASPWIIVGVFASADEAHEFSTKLQVAQDQGGFGDYRDDNRLFIPATENPQAVARLKTIPYVEYLESIHWQLIRKEALRRAGYRCQVCNGGSKLNVHHRTYAHRGEEREGDVIVLCESCHSIFHKIGTLVKE